MNDQPSPSGRFDDDGSGSPKRKKVRAKYAPKACVACRRSKLKCSGENPCLRCLDNGRRCFYSEDQTAAEALQNLSRPTPAQPPPPPAATFNGNGASRRNTVPRNEVTDRRASDASVLGLSMEARMARIEGMMETLIQDRPVGMTPRGSIETEDALVDGYNGEAMAQANMDAFAASLVPVRPPPPAFPPSAAHLQRQHSLPATNVFARAEDAPTVRHDGRDLHFPDLVDHQRYLNAFFWDLNTYYPCVNETIFRSQNEIMLEPTTIDDDSTCQLALNYIIFACVDVLGDTTRSGLRGRPAGWQWFQLADDLIDKRKFSGRGDLSLIQCLILQALYLMFADQPDAAYTTIGLTCRLCYQFSLHQESPQTDYTPFERQLRQRIFWVVYIVDVRISLSCARPYSIQSANLTTPRPKEMYDFHPEPNVALSPSERIPDLSSMFLSCMTFWPRLAGNAWDNLYAAGRKKQDSTAEALDTQIKGHMEATLSFVPFLVKSSTGDTLPEQTLSLRRYVVVLTSYTSLRLLLYRPSMTTLAYDAKTGRHCGTLAVQIVQNVAKVVPKSPISSEDPRSQVSEPLGAAKFHITTALASALLTLCTLLLSDLHSLGLVDHMDSWSNTFYDGVKMLHALAMDYVLAARVARDFQRASLVIEDVLNGMSLSQAMGGVGSLRDLLPYRTMEAEDPDRKRHVGDGGWNDEIQIFAPGKGVLWL